MAKPLERIEDIRGDFCHLDLSMVITIREYHGGILDGERTALGYDDNGEWYVKGKVDDWVQRVNKARGERDG